MSPKQEKIGPNTFGKLIIRFLWKIYFGDKNTTIIIYVGNPIAIFVKQYNEKALIIKRYNVKLLSPDSILLKYISNAVY